MGEVVDLQQSAELTKLVGIAKDELAWLRKNNIYSRADLSLAAKLRLSKLRHVTCIVIEFREQNPKQFLELIAAYKELAPEFMIGDAINLQWNVVI